MALLERPEVGKAATKKLITGWHGHGHRCVENPCEECLDDGRRAMQGAADAVRALMPVVRASATPGASVGPAAGGSETWRPPPPALRAHKDGG